MQEIAHLVDAGASSPTDPEAGSPSRSRSWLAHIVEKDTLPPVDGGL